MIYNDKKFIGNVLKQARVNAKLSQGQLAERIGLSEKHVSNIERGLNLPALDTFFNLCEVFNLSLKDFGLQIQEETNIEKEKILSKIFKASNKDLIAYNTLINTFEDLILEYKK